LASNVPMKFGLVLTFFVEKKIGKEIKLEHEQT
jgi:hypothetical protein